MQVYGFIILKEAAELASTCLYLAKQLVMNIHPYFEALANHPDLKPVFEDTVRHELKARENIPLYLYNSIISQQLSTRVADVIYERFLGLYGGAAPSSEAILATPLEKLQSIGLSRPKAGYIQNIARFDLEQGLDIEKLNLMTNEEVGQYIGSIKGVGQWTVQVLLMFALAREDVFVADDLIIQNTMADLFGLDRNDRKKLRKQIIELAERWTPYRSYVCVHLWYWNNNQKKKP